MLWPIVVCRTYTRRFTNKMYISFNRLSVRNVQEQYTSHIKKTPKRITVIKLLILTLM